VCGGYGGEQRVRRAACACAEQSIGESHPCEFWCSAVQCSAAHCGARTWDTTWHGTTAAGRIWGRARQNQVVVYNGYYSTVSATGQRRNLQEGERLPIFFAGPPLAPVGGNSGLGQWRNRRARGPLGSALRDDAGAASAPEVWLWLFGFGRQLALALAGPWSIDAPSRQRRRETRPKRATRRAPARQCLPIHLPIHRSC